MPIAEKYLADFQPGKYYHVYNRSISNRLVFRENKNYYYFLRLLKERLAAIVEIYAYALIPNHFHLLIKVPETNQALAPKVVSNSFRSFFIAYTTAVNKLYSERGRIFQTPFRRIHIDSDDYFTQLVYYIHYNGVHHNLCTRVDDYKWTSYQSLLSNKPTLLKREKVLEWFGGETLFIKYHAMQYNMLNEGGIFIE